MFTECPNCHTYFKITPQQLKAADGKVRCGGCSQVFNALRHLVDKAPSQNNSSGVLTPPPESRLSTSQVSSEIDPKKSSVAPGETINLADTEMSVSTNLSDSEQGKSTQAAANIDDINKDIDDALDNLFDESDFMGDGTSASLAKPAQVNRTEVKTAESQEKKVVIDGDAPERVTPKNSLSETVFDLTDGFDEFLHDDPIDINSPGLESLSSSDFSSSEAIETNHVEWETLTRPASPPSPATKTSKFDGIMSVIRVRLNFSRAIWIAVICCLLVVLMGQFAYSKHQELVKYPSIRPILESACAMINLVVDCQVPAPKDIGAIVVVDTVVEGHPKAESALLITSSIRSDAEFNQAFPDLVLTFSDFKKKIMARRVFTPDEYLTDRSDLRRGMSPRAPVKIMLEIVDPGKDAVNYEFDFR